MTTEASKNTPRVRPFSDLSDPILADPERAANVQRIKEEVMAEQREPIEVEVPFCRPVTAESLEHGRGCSTVILPSGQALVASELGLVRVLACLALDEWEKKK